MINLDLVNIYNYYTKEYEKIFNHILPINHAERFTEENQTLNFFNAVRKVHASAVAWFEYPWNVKGVTFGKEKSSSKRFDAIIYIEKLNVLLIVESKCLRNQNKYKAITNDFCRTLGRYGYRDDEEICDFKPFVGTDKKLNIHLNGNKPAKVYSVILADYWHKPKATTYKNIHTHWKIDTDNNYQGTDYYSKFLGIINEASETGIISTPETQVLQISNSLLDKYHLLTMIAEIKKPNTIYDFK